MSKYFCLKTSMELRKCKKTEAFLGWDYQRCPLLNHHWCLISTHHCHFFFNPVNLHLQFPFCYATISLHTSSVSHMVKRREGVLRASERRWVGGWLGGAMEFLDGYSVRRQRQSRLCAFVASHRGRFVKEQRDRRSAHPHKQFTVPLVNPNLGRQGRESLTRTQVC